MSFQVTYESPAFVGKKDSTKRREGCVNCVEDLLNFGMKVNKFTFFCHAQSFFIEFAERLRPHLTGASVLVVTGGFRSLDAMHASLSSTNRICDIVGLGRPLVTEPYLVKDMISGKLTDRAKENNMEDIPRISAAYGLLLKEIGLGRPVSDLSDAETFKQICAGFVSSPVKA